MSQPHAPHLNSRAEPHATIAPSPPLSSVGYLPQNSSSPNATGKSGPRIPRGRALLLEHVPIEFLRSTQGVKIFKFIAFHFCSISHLFFHQALLIVYSNGDACLFPVNDQPKQTSINSVKVLSKEGGPRTKIARMSPLLFYVKNILSREEKI